MGGLLFDKNDVESGMAYFRQNEKLLQATINDIIQNQRKKRRAIKKYVKCKSEQQHEESFSLFLKGQKSNSENEVCEPPGIFSEQDIQDLNQLIYIKYDILWRWNKALFNYEFASKYMEHTLSLLQRMYNDF
ncbi:unnamed protein product [Schistosoma bovis]|nr:unnamed protein product [Schistosoma bovis]